MIIAINSKLDKYNFNIYILLNVATPVNQLIYTIILEYYENISI